MPITTYLNDSDKRRAVGDPKLAAALEELRKTTGGKWYALGQSFTKRRWFRKTQTVVLYELLYDYLGTDIEYQAINFYREGTDWSINTYVPAELIVAYIYGLLGSRNKKEVADDSSIACNAFLCLPERNSSHYVDGKHLPRREQEGTWREAGTTGV